jgi:DNA-binding transcriptional LysR family regulator
MTGQVKPRWRGHEPSAPQGSEPHVEGSSQHVAPRLSDSPSPRPPRAGSTIRSQDLVSVPVLRALLQERSVTRAADVVGLSQPAVSHALARLRRRLGDDLLVRVGREFQLTPLGQSLLDRAENVYDALERLFEQDFDPATSTRRFTLVQSDYSMVLLAQPLTRILRSDAPGVRLSFQQLTSSVGDFQETLRQSDGIIVPPGHIRGHPNARLLTDRWVCVVSRDNPHVGDVLTVDDLARLPWVASYDQTLISASAPLRHMRAQGVEPRVEVSVEGFLAVPSLIQGTDRVAFVHEKLARLFTHLADIRVLPSPLPNEEHLAVLYWDAIATNDPGHRWFRDVLSRAAAAVDAEDTAPALAR